MAEKDDDVVAVFEPKRPWPDGLFMEPKALGCCCCGCCCCALNPKVLLFVVLDDDDEPNRFGQLATSSQVQE